MYVTGVMYITDVTGGADDGAGVLITTEGRHGMAPRPWGHRGRQMRTPARASTEGVTGTRRVRTRN